ncbi:MAG: hypothetical protein Fur0042_26650 [Cyanophyceae cyanobacterium]
MRGSVSADALLRAEGFKPAGSMGNCNSRPGAQPPNAIAPKPSQTTRPRGGKRSKLGKLLLELIETFRIQGHLHG